MYYKIAILYTMLTCYAREYGDGWEEERCQKKLQIQTGLGLLEEKLSEKALDSDRFEVKRGKPVKISPGFRQLCGGKRKSCQNNLWIQTGFR